MVKWFQVGRPGHGAGPALGGCPEIGRNPSVKWATQLVLELEPILSYLEFTTHIAGLNHHDRLDMGSVVTRIGTGVCIFSRAAE